MLGFRRSPTVIDSKAWEFRTRTDYFRASYNETAVALRTLEGLVGSETFARAMREYVERYRFHHPTGDDLFSVFEEVAGEDLDWFFEQAFRSDATPDWAVASVRQRRSRRPEGFFWDGEGWSEARGSEDSDDGDGRWAIELDIVRRGAFVGPVEVWLRYADGSDERRSWDSRDRWTRWSFHAAHPLEWVVIDPDGVWALETSRRDNYWRSDRDRSAGWRRLWWVAEVLQLLGLNHLPWS